MEKQDPQINSTLRNGIGTLKEKSLHANLIEWYSKPGDKFEERVNGYIIDIVRGDLLIEIQTKNFNSINNKLSALCQEHQVHLLYPIAKEKWIVRKERNNEIVSRRKSPKQGKVEDVFSELVKAPAILTLPNLMLCVLLIQAEEIWKNDGKGSWRRGKWSVEERYLLKVIDQIEFLQLRDLINLLPESLPGKFSNTDVSEALGISKTLARKMSYCLRKMKMLEVVGNRGREDLFSVLN